MSTEDHIASGPVSGTDSRPAVRRKLGRGLGALLGEARREEPLVARAR
jgi:hypothetical protein